MNRRELFGVVCASLVPVAAGQATAAPRASATAPAPTSLKSIRQMLLPLLFSATSRSVWRSADLRIDYPNDRLVFMGIRHGSNAIVEYPLDRDVLSSPDFVAARLGILQDYHGAILALQKG